MKLPSRLLGAMILSAGLSSLSIGCSSDTQSNTTVPPATESVSIDSAQHSPSGPDTAEEDLQVNPPDSMHPDHPASFNCPACGMG